MNHAITIGDVLRVAGVLACLLALIGGFLMTIAGGFIPAPGPQDERNSKVGCIISIVGIVLIAVMLAGCNTTAAVQTKTVEVDVPVATHPIDPKKIPPAPPPLGPRPKSLQAVADVALAGHCRDVSWIIKVFPLLQVGAGLPPSQAPVYPECAKH